MLALSIAPLFEVVVIQAVSSISSISITLNSGVDSGRAQYLLKIDRTFKFQVVCPQVSRHRHTFTS